MNKQTLSFIWGVFIFIGGSLLSASHYIKAKNGIDFYENCFWVALYLVAAMSGFIRIRKSID